MALHALRHFTCSAQQDTDDSAPCNTRSDAAQAVALQDFLFWLSSYRCRTCPHTYIASDCQWDRFTRHAVGLCTCAQSLLSNTVSLTQLHGLRGALCRS